MSNHTFIDEIKKLIYLSRPIFGKIMQKYGDKSLYEYTKEFLDVHMDANLEARRPICLQIVKGEIEKRLGESVAKEVERQLLKMPLVNTIDHHSLIDHPFWINTNIVTALPYKKSAKRKALKYLIVFSFASVSLNNASGYPRGILFHGGEHGEGPLIRLPILTDKWKMRTVYGTPSYTREDLDRAKALLKQKVKEKLISADRAQQILDKVFTELEKEDVLNSEDFSSQITMLNYRLWPQYFADEEMPKLIYIEAETMAREILIQEVLHDEDCLLYEMLFNPSIRDLTIKYFENIPGAFSIKDGWGTFFFWTFDEKGHRLQLLYENGKLTTKDQSYQIELTPEAVSEALRTKKIFPSMMQVYLILSLHYGFKCLGGFSQVHDLTKMKEALLHLLVDMGNFREIHSVCRIQTKEFGGDGIVLAYIKNEKGELTPATGIDMLLSDRKLTYDDYRKLSKKVNLGEMLSPMLPEIYTVLYPSYERKEDQKIPTGEEIIKVTGLQDRLEKIIVDLHSPQAADNIPEEMDPTPERT